MAERELRWVERGNFVRGWASEYHEQGSGGDEEATEQSL